MVTQNKKEKLNILIIDNYDSFTYNLYQYIGEIMEKSSIDFAIDVLRNDAISLKKIDEKNYNRVIISPGPGNPADKKYFGVCADILTNYSTDRKYSVLGVCLGMQGMAHYFGGKVKRAQLPMHGKISEIKHDKKGVFVGLPQILEVMRYHSLIADENEIPETLVVTAKSTDSNEIMGLRHKIFPIEGIQFHPESFATEGGQMMLKNYLFN